MASIELALRSLARQDLLVGFSGGLDSTVLLHALAAQAQALDCRLRSIHVDHGLHPRSAEWAAHCASLASSLGIELLVERVRVGPAGGRGLEAAAREARYAAFLRHLRPGECLVLAHHRGDQAETVVLRLLRASASAGLGAMRASRMLAAHPILRPLLATGRAELSAYATAAGLHWIEDPSNTDLALDRNYLRHDVMPRLVRRWPQAEFALARSAALLAEDAGLLAEIAAEYLAKSRDSATGGLGVGALLGFRPAWRSRILRQWVEEAGLPPLPGKAVDVIESALLGTRADSRAEYRWQGWAMRRWRDHLYLDRVARALPGDWQSPWDGLTPLVLPTGEKLELLATTEPGGAPARAAGSDELRTGLHVRARRGGERIVLAGRRHSHSLKHCLQAASILPWRRDRLPLLIAADGEVLAAGDAVISARLSAWCDERNLILRHAPSSAVVD